MGYVALIPWLARLGVDVCAVLEDVDEHRSAVGGEFVVQGLSCRFRSNLHPRGRRLSDYGALVEVLRMQGLDGYAGTPSTFEDGMLDGSGAT